MVSPDAEKINDESAFEAIKQLHKNMDDDHSGTIDYTESIGVRFHF